MAQDRGAQSLKRLDWLVQSRCRIQILSLDILTLFQTKQIASSDDATVKRIASVLLGVAFSLWRAVFLAHPSQSWEDNLEHAESYLQKVIEHNTITYTDDISKSGWSFEYYLNNAHLRIHVLSADIPELKNTLQRETAIPTVLGGALAITEEADTQTLWDEHCTALAKAVSFLKLRVG